MSTGTRSTTRRVVTAVAAAALAIGTATACEGDDKGKGDGKPAKTSAAPSDPATDASPPSESTAPPVPEKPSSGKTLTKAELTKAALVSGEVAGFDVTPMQGGEGPGTEKSDKPACEPLAAVINGAPEPAAAATVYRTAVDSTEEGDETQTVVTLILTSHADGGAQQVITSLRAAVDACAGGFTTHGGDGVSTYSEAKKLPTPKAGDESIAYQVTGAFEGDKVPLVFYVVRRGASLVTFYTANFIDETTPEVPSELIRKQSGKLP
jgi:hypothetical protein